MTDKRCGAEVYGISMIISNIRIRTSMNVSVAVHLSNRTIPGHHGRGPKRLDEISR